MQKYAFGTYVESEGLRAGWSGPLLYTNENIAYCTVKFRYQNHLWDRLKVVLFVVWS